MAAVRSWLRKVTDLLGRRGGSAADAADAWHAQDFVPAAEPPPALDPWAAEPPPAADRPARMTDSWTTDDFASAAPVSELPPSRPASGFLPEPELLAPALDLPDYDPNLRQGLEKLAPGPVGPERARAREKAAAIAALLEISSRRELESAIDWLEDLFLEQAKPATFRALEDIAKAGIDLATLRNVVELRALWARHPEWWVRRSVRRARGGSELRRSSEGRSRRGNGSWRGVWFEFGPLPNGPAALSWAQAHRICTARADYPVEEMIDPDWLRAWYRLPRMPGSPVSFREYIDEVLAEESDAQLRRGLEACEQAGSLDEPCDRHDWASGFRDPRDGTPLGRLVEEVIGPPVKWEPTNE